MSCESFKTTAPGACAWNWDPPEEIEAGVTDSPGPASTPSENRQDLPRTSAKSGPDGGDRDECWRGLDELMLAAGFEANPAAYDFHEGSENRAPFWRTRKRMEPNETFFELKPCRSCAHSLAVCNARLAYAGRACCLECNHEEMTSTRASDEAPIALEVLGLGLVFGFLYEIARLRREAKAPRVERATIDGDGASCVDEEDSAMAAAARSGGSRTIVIHGTGGKRSARLVPSKSTYRRGMK